MDGTFGPEDKTPYETAAQTPYIERQTPYNLG